MQRRFSGNDSDIGTTEHVGSWQHTRTKFADEEQQKLEEKAVEVQAEDEVENHVDEAKKVQRVKKCHMRNSSTRQTSSRSGHAKQQEVQQTSHQIQDCRRAQSP